MMQLAETKEELNTTLEDLDAAFEEAYIKK